MDNLLNLKIWGNDENGFWSKDYKGINEYQLHEILIDSVYEDCDIDYIGECGNCGKIECECFHCEACGVNLESYNECYCR